MAVAVAAFLAAADTETAGKSTSAPLQSRGTGSPTSTDTDPSPSRQIELSLQSINEKPFEVLDATTAVQFEDASWTFWLCWKSKRFNCRIRLDGALDTDSCFWRSCRDPHCSQCFTAVESIELAAMETSYDTAE